MFMLISPIDTITSQNRSFSFPFCAIFTNNHITSLSEDKEQFICDSINELCLKNAKPSSLAHFHWFSRVRREENIFQPENEHEKKRLGKNKPKSFRVCKKKQAQEKCNEVFLSAQKPMLSTFFMFHQSRHDNVNIFSENLCVWKQEEVTKLGWRVKEKERERETSMEATKKSHSYHRNRNRCWRGKKGGMKGWLAQAERSLVLT